MYNQYLSRISITVFAVVFLFLGGSNLASAATFTVTKTADTNDGLCDADCSLREAVFAALRRRGCALCTASARVHPLTQTTCFSVWTTSTRSRCASMTASMSL